MEEMAIRGKGLEEDQKEYEWRGLKNAWRREEWNDSQWRIESCGGREEEDREITPRPGCEAGPKEDIYVGNKF